MAYLACAVQLHAMPLAFHGSHGSNCSADGCGLFKCRQGKCLPWLQNPHASVQFMLLAAQDSELNHVTMLNTNFSLPRVPLLAAALWRSLRQSW
jgi:hypothetical protein